ncbi:MAG: beta-ketoacyl-[acyl-carrier-protein] synthase family protein [Planctomycetaceae bacterium]|jgi:3-oxoacyl-[acyl-carrier-protein] synthase II|nr:beta-ketoacyl-[acyl-carrier-protein] synthase family protein [Planctomycetaceae bacterium]MDB4864549.1 beta-ketoacyl-[acyl-carrier-protein] synthase family protein [Pirellulaceae bacterium]
MSENQTRIVITGLGQISAFGNTIDQLSVALDTQQSGVRTLEQIPYEHLLASYGGEAWDFTGNIDNYGPLEKTTMRAIKKGSRLMCREIQMGVASAQHALNDAGLNPEVYNPDRIGIVYGCDYILSHPQEFREGVRASLDDDGGFEFDNWAENGMPNLNPLWLLKYLPNMPASHIGIYNDLRGPSNSLTMREASSNLAIGEAICTIQRGDADLMISGATGTRIHPLRTVYVNRQEVLASNRLEATKASRPFERDREGMVIGEGAGSFVLERLEHALEREAKIYGEIVGFGSSTVINTDFTPQFEQAISNVIEQALNTAGMTADQIGHVNAHGISKIATDRAEARAINAAFGNQKPVVALKSYTGNMGAGSGAVELIGSLEALRKGFLFRTLNYDTPDPECNIYVTDATDIPAGNSFINLSVTPQGQASAVIVKTFKS